MKKLIAVVRSSNPDCPDTNRAELFLNRRLMKGLVQYLKQDSDPAKRLWAAALPKLSGKVSGHPLVCILLDEGDDLTVLFACAEPDNDQLTALLTQGHYKLWDTNCLPEISDITVGQG